MGPNTQRKKREPKKGAAPRGQRGQPAANTPGVGVRGGADAQVGIHRQQREMLVDVLRHVATGGKTKVADSAFSDEGSKVTFFKNSAMSPLELAHSALERLGYPPPVVSAYLRASPPSEEEQVEWKTIADVLANEDFIMEAQYDLFATTVQFLYQQNNGSVFNAGAELVDKVALRQDLKVEWETINVLFGDQLLRADDEFTDADDSGSDGEIEDEDFLEAVFQFRTQDDKPLEITLRFFPDYPTVSTPMVCIAPTNIFTPRAHKAIVAACAREVSAMLGQQCVLSLLTALRAAIEAEPSAAKEEADERKKAEENRLKQKAAAVSEPTERAQFLNSLIVQDQMSRQVPASVTGSKPRGHGGKAPLAPVEAVSPIVKEATSAAVKLPEKVELQQLHGEEARRMAASKDDQRNQKTRGLVRNPQLDQKLKKRWEHVSQHGKLTATRQSLPAYKCRDELFAALNSDNRVLVVGGDTGSGKTTQIPQYVLEHAIENGNGSICNVVCTQPRRLAATAVAVRVSEERDEEQIGGQVGYSIRLESKMSADTQLLYCTTGILLRRMQSDSQISSISHVVVDEIHERGIDTDFLLILLRDLMTKRKDLRLILMSATMNAELFSNYFGGAPVLSIAGRTFPVTVHHLERLLPMVGYHLEENSAYAVKFKSSADVKRNNRSKHVDEIRAQIDEHKDDFSSDSKIRYIQMTARGSDDSAPPVSYETATTISMMDPDRINYDLIERLVDYIDEKLGKDDNGAILIFMPGMAEINQCCDELRSNDRLLRRCQIHNLHSSLGNSSQTAVFAKPPKGMRKVVVGTNIMETSITIDDAVYVIDCGKFKENRYDAKRSLSQLVTSWVSRAAANQRKGRAGRVRPGVCFRLFTTHAYENLEAHQVCEMQRVPLESLILQIHVLGLGNEMEFLRQALDPPKEKAVQSSVSVLTTMGALQEAKDKESRSVKNLTSLGFHLANLPIDVRIGKITVIAALLNCLDPALTIAACLSVKSPFSAAPDMRNQVDAIRRSYSKRYNSDLFAMYFAYSGWLSARQRGPAAARKFVFDSALSEPTLRQIQQTKQQYERYLVEADFVRFPSDSTRGGGHGFMRPPYITLEDIVYEAGGREFNINSGNMKCVSAALVAGLYPNVARIAPPAPTVDGYYTKKPSDRMKLFTADGMTEVYIHPSSVTGQMKRRDFTYPFLLYVEKMKTTQTYLRDITMVSPYSLVLFGGNSYYNTEYKELILDDWVSFACAETDAVLLKRLREQIESALWSKVNDPTYVWDSTSTNVVKAMEKLLQDEGTKSLVVTERRDRKTRFVDPEAEEVQRPKLSKFEQRKIERLAATRCFNCGEKGHLSRDCAFRGCDGTTAPNEPCFVCGGKAHFATHCPLTQGTP